MVMIILSLLFLLLFGGGLMSVSFSSKGSPFECGFNSFSMSGISFSMSFFFISLIFIIFDVEILLLCFYPLSGLFNLISMFFLILVILIIFFATVYEWWKGILSWV